MNIIPFQPFKMRGAIVAALLALVATVGCRQDAPVPEGVIPQQQPLPGVLRDAKLLFQRPDGIYLVRPFEGNARRVTPDAIYPRWLPDGRRFVFIRADRVMLHDTVEGGEHELAQGRQLRAVAANPVNGNVLFASGTGIHRVIIGNREIQRLIPGDRTYGLDAHGNLLMATEKAPLRGFGIVRYTLPATGEGTLLGRGCSASLSPDGTLTTLNLHGHRQLAILDVHSGTVRKTLHAPEGKQLDNHAWSNHPDWIATVSHGGDILLQRVSDEACWQITSTGDADRPDLFIP